MGTGKILLTLSEGSKKVELKTVQLGKTGSADDLTLQLSGNIALTPRFMDSNLDSKLKLTVSEKVLQALPLLQALLRMAVQPDGSFAYQLSGPLLTPFPVPLKE